MVPRVRPIQRLANPGRYPLGRSPSPRANRQIDNSGRPEAGVAYTTPGLARRIASTLYDGLLAAAVLFIAAFAFSALTRFTGTGPLRPILQIYVLGVLAGYFVWFWSCGRRTLAMKTWGLRLVTRDGNPLTPTAALLRFALAWLMLVGIGVLWALFDRDGLFLHDRLAGTRLVLGR